MKNKSIIFGSIFAVCIFLLMPNISAIEYQTMENKIVNQRNNAIENMQSTINSLKNTLKNIEINVNLLLTILIKGIILPIIGYTISNIVILSLIDMLPTILAPIIALGGSFISGSIVVNLFLIPTLDAIYEETDSYPLAVIVYFLLAYFDLIVAKNIAKIILDL